MSLEQSNNFLVRFNGKNYSAWSFQFEILVKGKELWGYVDGTESAPDSKEKEKLAKWKVKDAQIMSWILGSMEPSMILNLRPYKSSKDMWGYLKKVYNQSNAARRFQLELELGQLSQGSMTIQEFYSSFENLWNEYTDIVYESVSAEGLVAVQSVHETSKRDQFLMKLRGDFEPVRSNLMNRNPVPSIDTCIGELFREEQRLMTQTFIDQKSQNSSPIPVAYVAQGKHRGGRDMSNIQCYSCKGFGHVATNCTKKFCNYCKKAGHIIKDCPIRPPKKSETAYNVSVGSSNAPNFGQSSVTPEMIQQMIVNAFSTLGISGNKNSAHKPWYFDSAASNHMTSTTVPLNNVQKYKGDLHIQTADGNSLPITAVGDISTSLNTIFVSPKLSTNLISVGQLVDNNCTVQFSNSGCFVQDQVSGKMIAKGPKVGRLFPLLPSPSLVSNYVSCNAVDCNNQVWHKRLGHPNSHVLSILLKSGLLGNKVSNSSNTDNIHCASCKLGKSKTLPFPSRKSHTTKAFELVHTDVWGISPVVSHQHYKYFVTFIDDFSRYTWVYFLRYKSEVFKAFQTFHALIETQFSAKIRILQSDSGGEYTSNEFQSFLQNHGIISQRSCPSTPQQNGVAERKNRHLLDVVRTLLIESCVPSHFWCEALSTAVYLINRLPSPTLNNESPYLRLYEDAPDYSDLHIFGCVCFVHLQPHERNKLTAQSVKCAFLGYGGTQKGFLCYDPNTRRIRVSRNVIFFENQSFFCTQMTSQLPSIAILPHFPESSAPSQRFKPGHVYHRRTSPTMAPATLSDAPDPVLPSSNDPPPVRRSSRNSKPPDRYGYTNPVAMSTTLSPISIPTCYKQAMEHECWQQAMETELQALAENHTWDVVSLPPNVKPIGSKWVYSMKLKSDGSLDRYKARLVALGNKQEYGINYEETFAPVAKMTTVRTILAVASSKSWPLHQMDVKNAFLNGDLKEEIYMKLPHGMAWIAPNKVCRLRRTLYGLRQSPREWFDKFRHTLINFSFTQSQYDSSLFFHKTQEGMVFLLVYVDDIIITGSDTVLISKLKNMLHSTFQMKDLGDLKYFLGLEVHSRDQGIFLNQHKYVRDLIELAGLKEATAVDTPMEVNVKYRKDEGELLPNPYLYRQLVGSLIYLTITRPDISYAVHIVSRFMQSPRHLHLVAVKRIIRYLIGSPTRGLFFPKNSDLHLTAYSDADWAGCPDTRRSTTGWCTFLGDALISWKCKKQDHVSKSSTEAEYRAMSAACAEIVWLRGLLSELGASQINPTPLHADNKSAIQIASNPVFHERTKHIEVDCHYIRDAFTHGVIELPHVSTNLQTADVFTKALTRQRHKFLNGKLMLLDLPASI